MTLLLPALLILSGSPVVFGGARPVPVNPYNFKRGNKSNLLVSAAGITSNLLLALSFALLNRLFPQLSHFLLAGIVINVILFSFNVLPLPPLDGSRILYHFLSSEGKLLLRKLEPYGLLLIFATLYFFSGIVWNIAMPVANILFLIGGFNLN